MTRSPIEMDPEAMPHYLRHYLRAHRARDVDAAISSFASTAVVVDDGKTYEGLNAIRAWLARSSSEYQYTTTITGVSHIGESQYDVRQHLEGNFPSGEVDLHYRFDLKDGRIVRLIIEV
jgi:hypothetical protein